MTKTPFIATAVSTLLLMANILPASQECGKILNEKCTACHYNTRICEKVGDKNRRSWKISVKRMLRYGLKIEDSEIEEVVDCLVSLEDNPKIFCEKD